MSSYKLFVITYIVKVSETVYNLLQHNLIHYMFENVLGKLVSEAENTLWQHNLIGSLFENISGFRKSAIFDGNKRVIQYI